MLVDEDVLDARSILPRIFEDNWLEWGTSQGNLAPVVYSKLMGQASALLMAYLDMDLR
jgi:hypothetical protein